MTDANLISGFLTTANEKKALSRIGTLLHVLEPGAFAAQLPAPSAQSGTPKRKPNLAAPLIDGIESRAAFWDLNDIKGFPTATN